MVEENSLYNPTEILDSYAPLQKGERRFLQNNIGKQQAAQHTLLEIAFASGTTFVVIQEPWVFLNKEQKWQTITHPAYNLYLGEDQDNRRPRVATYIQKKRNYRIKKRQDLCKDSDLQILEVGELEPFLLVNLYNEKQLDLESRTQQTGIKTSIRLLTNLEIINQDLPIVLIGDFNCHCSLWNSAVTTDSHEAQEIERWLVKYNFTILNQQELTFLRPNLTRDSIIDLAFVARFKESTFQNWRIGEATGSDHQNIAFSLFTKETPLYNNPLNQPFNLKKANWEKFQEELQREKQNLLDYLDSYSPRSQQEQLKLSQEDISFLNNLEEKITTTIQRASRKAIPILKISPRSKPWWNKDLAILRKKMAKAKRISQENPTNRLISKAKAFRNKYSRAINIAKQQHWNSFLEEAKGKDIFTALKYTKPTQVQGVPEIRNRDNGLTDNFEEQCTALLESLFPIPPITAEPSWNSYKEGDWNWPKELEAIEVKRAILLPPNKAPGTDRISFKVL